MDNWIYSLSFYGIALCALAGACGVLFLRNLFHAGLSLILTLFSVAGLFVLLGAEFLAGVQVLIYVGAIAILILFAVMLTQRLTAKRVRVFNRAFLPALAAAGLFAAAGIWLLFRGEPRPWERAVGGGDAIPLLADALLSKHILPFEVVSLLLLGALIGAIVVARKEETK